jgi:hypothetical protein
MSIHDRRGLARIATALVFTVLSTLVVLAPAAPARAEGWDKAASDCWIWAATPYFWKDAQGLKRTRGDAFVWCATTRIVQVNIQVRDADPGLDDDVTPIFRVYNVEVPAGTYRWIITGSADGQGSPCINNKDPVGKEELYTRAQIVIGYAKSPWIRSSERSAWCS